MAQTNDFAIYDHPSQDSLKNISEVSEGEIIQKLRKIERKRNTSNIHRSPSYKFSKDAQVVYLKSPRANPNANTLKLIRSINKIVRRSMALSFQKVKQQSVFSETSINQSSISENSIIIQKDYRKFEQGLDDMDHFLKRKNQLMVVLAFFKISYEEKQVIKKRLLLENKLESTRIQNAFGLLRLIMLKKRSKGTQTNLLSRNASDSIFPKIQSQVTMFSSLAQVEKIPCIKTFSKNKRSKINISSQNLQQSKASQSSFETINLKLNRLDSLLQQVKVIKNSCQYKKRFSARELETPTGKRSGSLVSPQSTCQIPFEKSIWNCHNFKTSAQLEGENKESKKIQKKPRNLQQNQSSVRQTSIREQVKSDSKSIKKISQKIHKIIQPVIHQIIQPIHYYDTRMNSPSHATIYQNLTSKIEVDYVPQIIYRPVYRCKSPNFTKINSPLPRTRTIWE